MSHLHSLRATHLIYIHSVNNKVKPPWPSTQLQLLQEQPHAMFPRQMEANGRQCSHPGEDSRVRCPTTTASQCNQQFSTTMNQLSISQHSHILHLTTNATIYLYHISTTQQYSLQPTLSHSNGSAHILLPTNLSLQPLYYIPIRLYHYNLMLQPIYYVLQSKATSSILRPYNMTLQPI